MKLGIIIDSSAGLTADQAKQRGWILLPLFMNIDGKDYADGIDIDAKEFYKQADIEQEVRTSATPPAFIVEAYEKATKAYDQVLVYGLSEGLSSQTNNLKMFAQQFKNIHVVTSKNVGYSITKDCEYAEKLAASGKNMDAIIAELNQLSESTFGVAVPATMKWLVKGGRVSQTAAAMGNLLKIVPLISFGHDGKLDKYGKGRLFDKATVNMAKELIENNPDKEFLIYKGSFDHEEKLINELKVVLGQNVEIQYMPPVIAIHTGPEVIAVMMRDRK